MTNDRSSAASIQQRQQALGLTQMRLALLAGISVFMLNRALTGRGRALRPEELQRLDQVLSILERAQTELRALVTA